MAGDAVHAGDMGWINLALDGPPAIDIALRTVEELSQIPVRLTLPGHGPTVTTSLRPSRQRGPATSGCVPIRSALAGTPASASSLSPSRFMTAYPLRNATAGCSAARPTTGQIPDGAGTPAIRGVGSDLPRQGDAHSLPPPRRL